MTATDGTISEKTTEKKALKIKMPDVLFPEPRKETTPVIEKKTIAIRRPSLQLHRVLLKRHHSLIYPRR
ncbi:unnamed protein product [Callosobruchus maculatus]|uniref:Uncharacterized protein n=1 Tax=Callosobruchus maculatus TaxID=64391 RepID=A0A653D7T0_CALMS|nr:unnamed protein product [Callosobruchus maculatus]